MAKVHGFGMFSGKMGNHVYYIKNGKCYVREHTQKKDPNTWLQQMQRARFKAIQQFLRPLVSVIRIGYAGASQPLTAYNEAVKNLYGSALVNATTPDDEYPVFSINYQNVQLSRGIIEFPLLESITRTCNDITLMWDNDLGSDYNHHHDKCMLVAIGSPGQVYINPIIGQRSDGIGKALLPDEFDGPVHIWSFFYNDETRYMTKKNVSDSVYLGMV